MASDLITVLVIGRTFLQDELSIDGLRPYEASGFNVIQIEDDWQINLILAENHVNVICTFGDVNSFKILNDQQLSLRKKWLHYDDVLVSPSVVANGIMSTYVANATSDRFPDTPLVSVFTPTYKTEVGLLRPYKSLLAQSYDNWEWVIYDDSPDDKTFLVASSLAEYDYRIKVFKSSEPCGRIGEVKRRCCGLATGSIFVELDHDDELTSNCLADIIEAFQKFPQAGFAYTDCAEVFETGENATYGETYAFGFGSYRYEDYNGKTYAVSNYPSVNAKTVRHIVGMPNHVRAWKRDAYYAAGGHHSEIHVADDYELCIRTFLTTRMVHIKRLGYIQHLNTGGSNTQRVRNKEIQRLVRYFANHYNQQIHDRFAELGVYDFIWTDSGLNWDLDPSGIWEANLTLE